MNEELERIRHVLSSTHGFIVSITDDTLRADIVRKLVGAHDEKTFFELAKLRSELFQAIHAIDSLLKDDDRN